MVNAFFNWFVAADSRTFTFNNKLAVIIIGIVCASAFDVLQPYFEVVSELEDRNHSEQAANASSSNRFSQLLWISLMGLSVVAIMRDPRRFQRILWAQWPIALIGVFALISVVWALAPSIAFRRSVLLSFVFASIFVGACYLRTPYQIPLIIYRIASIALGFNLLAVGLGHFDIEGYFYGIHGHKNTLGAVALQALFFGFAARQFYPKSLNRPLNTLYLFAWFTLLLLSVSKTSIGLFFLIPIMVFGAQKIGRWLHLNLGFLLLIGVLLFTLFIFAILIWSDWHIKQLLAQFMADPTFTGRDYIWAFMLEQIGQRQLFGAGYGSFWGIGIHSPNMVFGQGFLTLLNQGHNGYLDLIAQLGWVGLGLYLITLVQFSWQSSLIQQHHPGLFALCWILLMLTLIHNITESSIMRGSHSLWVMQLLMFTLVARLYMDREKQP